ncbi:MULTISPECIES: Crp/Fnr family transcriptional regulator [unclassified Chitinophaga]|uniref:Crp/Fnr family transcriptional regulator n=1 Tax=unclassified Chitinophaga TaxID=2619133 RepID=UPI0009C9EB21|nr:MULTISPECIES: Crp/Fnr family transcriptional regulator [unclassified Chitinophaga]OMP75269.1 Crp/Fnr family transcriptional regulator [[Flexibacter] sp. ATCC 35208]OMP75836.1 Crp/Fnr family transcriptional regulator [[Flexibacter] sp. ATCC 35208]WPV66124.1 Crp/Fnr family transcriptional regulator [Chitinophaga sp. LS1]
MNLLIENIKSIVPLSPADEKIINSLFQKIVIDKDEHILQEGQICRRVVFIEKGIVRYYLRNNGEEQTFYFNKEGEWVCDYPSFLPKIPAITNIQALETTTAWVISYDDLQKFYQQVPQGERFGRLAIEQVYINAVAQLSSLYNDKPQARYQKFVQTYFDIAQRIPQYYIASYVGVKPQSLSRIRKRLIY